MGVLLREGCIGRHGSPRGQWQPPLPGIGSAIPKPRLDTGWGRLHGGYEPLPKAQHPHSLQQAVESFAGIGNPFRCVCCVPEAASRSATSW